MPVTEFTAGWGDSHVYKVNKLRGSVLSEEADGGKHRRQRSHSPEGPGKALQRRTFEVSPEGKQVPWGSMPVGEDVVPRRGDIKHKVLRPQRA